MTAAFSSPSDFQTSVDPRASQNADRYPAIFITGDRNEIVCACFHMHIGQ
jgi:hypothetical protein